MMKRLYAEPLRVYLLLTVLALAGIFCGLKLPVSLFPNSTKPVVWVSMSYGSLTSSEFIDSYGQDFENALRSIAIKEAHVELVESNYNAARVYYEVSFTWGSDPDAARKEVQSVATSWAARLPEDIRDTLSVNVDNENSGFFAASFYSDRRSTDEVYELVDAAFKARLSAVDDADSPGIWNPARREVRIELKPEAMASLGLVPRDIDQAVTAMMTSRRGGSIAAGLGMLQVELPRSIQKPEDLAEVPVPTPGGRVVHLADVARVDLGNVSTDTRLIKTSGAPSVVLFATPKAGGNIKRMSEDILALIEAARPSLPADVQYRVLVDPSEFIRSSIENVFHEVALGALLAVSVLFIFIGSLKNVITAAIEIPLSLVMAFILMKITGVNINLISLGGLALSAGMNVDGSVVVMENIFRHFGEREGEHLSASERLEILVRAVSEVRLPLIASTIASLVVFLPLTFTSALSNAILGDLAKAVVFSHGFSAIVALILVPTVRLQLMGDGSKPQVHSSKFEPFLGRLDEFYARLLGRFIDNRWFKWLAYAGLSAALAALVALVLPKLPREVIGTPDSDMIFMSMSTQGNTLVKQMESQSDDVERRLLSEFGQSIQYTFTQISGANRAWILAKLVHKSEMQTVWKALEGRFTDTPDMKYSVAPWNPSELPIPDPPALRVAIRGGDLNARRDVTLELYDLLESQHVFHHVSMEPYIERAKGLRFVADPGQWMSLARAGVRLTPNDLTDMTQVATQGRRIARMNIKGRSTDVILRYPADYLKSPEDLASMPVGIAGKVVPLKSLLPFKTVDLPPPVHREDGQDLFLIFGSQNKSDKSGEAAATAKAHQLITEWQAKRAAAGAAGSGSGALAADVESRPVVAIEDAGKDVTQAVHQLGVAIGISILLIFLVLIFQFGSIVESLLVLVAVPLGFIGVIVALYLTKSTLSLNSALGVILLNGIAVNNSIIMVDFIRRQHASGLSPRDAATESARKRLRPILITSLTTVLGMLPISLGYGEGGRILQPLGVAVSGGLWISMGLTLFLVPALQVAYLERKERRSHARLAV